MVRLLSGHGRCLPSHTLFALDDPVECVNRTNISTSSICDCENCLIVCTNEVRESDEV